MFPSVLWIKNHTLFELLTVTPCSLLRAVPCKTGYVSKTGLQPCFPCPRGYFQPQIGQSSCFLCPNNGKTDSTGSKSMLACDSVTDEKVAQYSSIPTTELLMNDCFRDPCMNGAKCVSLAVGYKCHCTPGYIGTLGRPWICRYVGRTMYEYMVMEAGNMCLCVI